MGNQTNRGGARVGAGRKRKALTEKMAEGDRGHRAIKKMGAPNYGDIPDLEGVEMLPPSEWLSADTKNTTANVGARVYTATYGDGVQIVKDGKTFESIFTGYKFSSKSQMYTLIVGRMRVDFTDRLKKYIDKKYRRK